MNTITIDVQSVNKSDRGRAESDRDVCPINDYYVYALLAPGRTHEVFYIGKGKGDRCKHHFYPSAKGQNPRKDRILAKYPGCYVEKIAENLSENQAFALEVHLIAMSPEGCLTNMTLGGQGISGRPCTDETKARISKAHTGKKGRIPNNETKAKMSKAQKGRTLADETRAKISKSRIGLHCGEKSPKAKLTWAKVNEIREKLAAGEKLAFIAREYSVCPRTIREIKNNRSWVRTSAIE